MDEKRREYREVKKDREDKYEETTAAKPKPWWQFGD